MKYQTKNWVTWLVLAVLGLFLIFGHNAALNLICKVIAIGLILLSLPGVINWWKTKDKAPEAIASLVISLGFCLLGLWILCSTQGFINLINLVLGLAVIIISAAVLYSAWKVRHTSSIIMACIGLVLGIIIACSNAATTLFTVSGGIGLIYIAVTGYLSELKNGDQVFPSEQ